MVLRGMAVAPGEQMEVAGIYQSQLSRTTFAIHSVWQACIACEGYCASFAR